jgi:cytochrome c biogenesis protein CcmG/thiol:disulfide interchange protein DsbE
VASDRRIHLRRRTHALAWLAGAVALGATCFIGTACGGPSPDRAARPRIEIQVEADLTPGGRIDRLVLPALEGDGSFDYGRVADRPLVMNFFASWCRPCAEELPEIERVYRELGERIAFVGVSQSDARSSSIRLVHETGVTFPTAFDPEGRSYERTGARGMPTTVLVRPGGEVADVWVGPLDAPTLRELIARELAPDAGYQA